MSFLPSSLLLSLVTVGLATDTSTLWDALSSSCTLESLHKAHRARHGLTRPPSEQAARLSRFRQEIRAVLEARNDAEVTWQVDVSFMADMSDEEQDLYKTGYNVTLYQSGASEGLQSGLLAAGTAPAKYDGWVERGYLRPVVKQEKDSCWAHSAASVLEAQLAAKKGRFEKLSVQELFDCGQKKGHHDDGGNAVLAWKYVKKSDRLTWDKVVPEIPGKNVQGHSCSYYRYTTNALEGTRLTRIYYMDRDEVPGQLEWVVSAITPVAVGVGTYGKDLERYSGGIFRPTRCAPDPDHAMTMVGYAPDYWKVRNSWANWGENGYVRWSRTARECFLLDLLCYPYLEAETPIQKRENGEIREYDEDH